jgi:nucleotide-binding universal stress UspA family protein
MSIFKKPLVVITESCDPGPAFEQALKLARGTNLDLTLLDVAEPAPAETRTLLGRATLDTLQAAAVEQRTSAMAALAAQAKSAGVRVITRIAAGVPFQVAIQTAVRDQHDVLLKTIDRHSPPSRSTQGSADKNLLRKCPCPVWLLAAVDVPEPGSIVAAVNPDPSAPEDRALGAEILRMAAAIAASDQVALNVVHAWKVFGELLLRGPKPLVSDQEVDHIMGQALNRHVRFLDELIAGTPLSGVVAKPHVVHARAADAIIDFVQSQPTRLLVIGTVGRTGIPGFLIGNTAEQVLSEVTCSVLALKPRGFVSPVTIDP